MENLIESPDREPVMVFTSGGGEPPAKKSSDNSGRYPDRGATAAVSPDGGGRGVAVAREGDSLNSYYWGSSTDLDSPPATMASTRVGLWTRWPQHGRTQTAMASAQEMSDHERRAQDALDR